MRLPHTTEDRARIVTPADLGLAHDLALVVTGCDVMGSFHFPHVNLKRRGRTFLRIRSLSGAIDHAFLPPPPLYPEMQPVANLQEK